MEMEHEICQEHISDNVRCSLTEELLWQFPDAVLFCFRFSAPEFGTQTVR